MIASLPDAYASDADSQAPPMPAGFKTPEEAKAAVLMGQVPIISLVAPVPDTIKVTQNVVYGEADGETLRLDLYEPKDRTRATPGLILIHGGGWRKGKRQSLQPYCVWLAERGYVTATISYRLADEHPYPAAVEDAKCAVRWMRANAEDYGVDPDMIGVLGGSAGGHLAMMVGYSSDVPELEGEGGHAGVSSRVRVVVNFFGPTDLTTPYAQHADTIIRFMGGKTYDEVESHYVQASPVSHITVDDPPTLTLHGTIDELVPVSQAETLHNKLTAMHLTNRMVLFEGWPHTMNLAKPVNDRCMWEINRFLDEHLSLSQTNNE